MKQTISLMSITLEPTSQWGWSFLLK